MMPQFWKKFDTKRKIAIIGATTLGLSLIGWLAFANRRPTGSRRVIALGDSITVNSIYGQTLANLLRSNNKTVGSSVVSQGYGGKGTAYIYNQLTTALAQNPTDLVVLAGVNDIPGALSAQQIFNNLQKIWLDARQAGVRVIAVQVLPFGSWTSTNQYGHFEGRNYVTKIRELNRLIAASDVPDAVVKVNNFDDGQGNLIKAAGSGDGLHPGAAGHKILGQLIYDQAF